MAKEIREEPVQDVNDDDNDNDDVSDLFVRVLDVVVPSVDTKDVRSQKRPAQSRPAPTAYPAPTRAVNCRTNIF